MEYFTEATIFRVLYRLKLLIFIRDLITLTLLLYLLLYILKTKNIMKHEFLLNLISLLMVFFWTARFFINLINLLPRLLYMSLDVVFSLFHSQTLWGMTFICTQDACSLYLIIATNLSNIAILTVYFYFCFFN